MFGCHAIYIGKSIMLITRNRNTHPEDNGVWIATTQEHHESLRKDIPSMRRIRLLGNGETNWQNIPADAEDFEESVFRACALIQKHDKRIGKIPKAKKQKRN